MSTDKNLHENCIHVDAAKQYLLSVKPEVRNGVAKFVCSISSNRAGTIAFMEPCERRNRTEQHPLVRLDYEILCCPMVEALGTYCPYGEKKSDVLKPFRDKLDLMPSK